MGDSVPSSVSSSTISGDLVILPPSLRHESISLLTSTLSNTPHEVLKLNSRRKLHEASLAVAKGFLDPLAKDITSSNSVKSGRGGGTKGRKRSQKNVVDGGAGFVLDEIYLQGFDVDQVWEQVRLLVGQVEDSLRDVIAKNTAETEKAVVNGNGKKRKAAQYDEEDVQSWSDASEGEDGSEDSNEEEEDGLSEREQEQEEREMDEDAEMEDAEQDNSDEDGDLEDVESLDKEEGGVLVKDVHGLNDGFFSIDEFNRQTELLEMQDFNGEDTRFDEEDEEEEEEEEIDYNIDPDEMQIVKSARKVTAVDDEDEEDESEDEDLFGAGIEADEEANANEIKYEDFFAPPATLAKTSKAKSFPTRNQNADDGNANVLSDMARVHRDIFDDEYSEGEGYSSGEYDPGDPRSRKSAHERRQARLTEQIRKLEAANVAKRDWTLSGESRAVHRPLNSLLEEDLDFERIGKPVPVITQEVTEGLEDIIKRRILASEFDELQKRRPTDLNPNNVRRGRVDIDDSKPSQSLAELYEQDHLKLTDPSSAPAIDEKLAKEHAEIAALFQDVSRKLDALSSWHYTPKPPKPTITIVSDAPAISIEEAQPTAGLGGAEAASISMLAPQEVYDPVKDRKSQPRIPSSSSKEITLKSGIPISVSELTTEEKQRRRKNNKEKQRKKSIAEGKAHGKSNAKEGSRKDVLENLKRGGVKVIGKGGEKRDLDGNVVASEGKKGRSGSSGSGLKL